MTVVGSKKMVIYNDLVEEQLRIFDRGVMRPEEAPFERPLSYRYGDIVSPWIDFKEPLALELQHFVSCVQRGIAPRSDGENGLAVIAVLEAIDEAIATGAVANIQYPGRTTSATTQPISNYSVLPASA